MDERKFREVYTIPVSHRIPFVFFIVNSGKSRWILNKKITKRRIIIVHYCVFYIYLLNINRVQIIAFLSTWYYNILLYPYLLISRCVYRHIKTYRPRTSSSVDIIFIGSLIQPLTTSKGYNSAFVWRGLVVLVIVC